jgi:hypothetical protein
MEKPLNRISLIAIVFVTISLSFMLSAPCASSSGLLKNRMSLSYGIEQFGIVNVTLNVKDYDGTALADAEVEAFSEDWGMRLPKDYVFGHTDSNGSYCFRVPTGIWSFFAGAGIDYKSKHSGEGYFAFALRTGIEDNTAIVIQPNDTVEISVCDVRGAPLDDVEVNAMLSDYVPILLTPLCGIVEDGKISIHTGSGHNFSLFLTKVPGSNEGYFLIEESVTSGSRIVVKPKPEGLSHVRFQAVNASYLAKRVTVTVIFPFFDRDHWVSFRNFDIQGNASAYFSPTHVDINYICGEDRWYYCFAGTMYSFSAGSENAIAFGGPASVSLKAENAYPPNSGPTQMWLQVRDAFGNRMALFSDPKGNNISLQLVRDEQVIYNHTYGGFYFLLDDRYIDNSIEYRINLDLGEYGFFDFSGLLFSNETQLRRQEVQSPDFVIHVPEGFEDKTNYMVTLLESAFSTYREVLNGFLPYDKKINVYVDICPMAAGTAWGENTTVWLGGFLDSHMIGYPYSMFEGVLYHELAHIFQCTPQFNFFIAEAGDCWYGESITQIFVHEAILKRYGYRVALWDMGNECSAFFEHLCENKTDADSAIRFIEFYLKKKWGMAIHTKFIDLWANQSSATYKERLFRAGFSVNETVIILYSFLTHENLATLFQLANFDISEERVAEGLGLMAVQVIDHPIQVEDRIFHVVTESNSSVSEIALDQLQLRFNITGESGTIGYCNVTIPKSLMSCTKLDDWIVFVNGIQLRQTQLQKPTDNATHTFIYFTSMFASNLQVTIKGTYVVPEFPSFLILQLFIIATLLVVMLYRRSSKHNLTCASQSRTIVRKLEAT